MCECVKSESLLAGWLCCGCHAYCGMQRRDCRACCKVRCKPLLPDRDSGEHFESYEEAYVNDPDILARINEQLAHGR